MEIGIWGFSAWSLFVLIVGFVLGRANGKAMSRGTPDRGRLDRVPPSLAADPSPARQGPPELSPEASTSIHDALRAGNKIHAIKMMRDKTGLGLAEAKNAVEAMER